MPRATLLVWFQLRSPECAEEFERLMAEDRDVVRQSFDTVAEWRLTRPLDVPGQEQDRADYVLIAEITELARWERQAEAELQRLVDKLSQLVTSPKMLIVQRVL